MLAPPINPAENLLKSFSAKSHIWWKKVQWKKLVIQKRTDIKIKNVVWMRQRNRRRLYYYYYLYILWLFGLTALDNAQKICVKFEQELPVI